MSDSESGRSSLVAEFCKVTSVEPDLAKLFLEAAEWNYNLAISRFYEDIDAPSEDTLSAQTQSSQASAAAAAAPRIATMTSLVQNAEKNEEEGQEFYVGGSGRTGQHVLGPNKRKGHHIIEEIFRAAKDHGAEVIEPTENRCNSAHLRPFRGTGYVLGSTLDQSNALSDKETTDVPNQGLDICLLAWRTGFTVENGQLREYDDPRNKEFLHAIRKGEIPQELISKAKGREINLSMEDHSHEDYAPPKQSLLAFSGQGHKLRSRTPPTSSVPMNDNVHKNKTEAENTLNVDHSQPITTIQIRLADGSRISLELNHSHTVGDIRQYLVAARPEYSATMFSLMTPYPPTELTNDNATVQEANLLNSVITQKFL